MRPRLDHLRRAFREDVGVVAGRVFDEIHFVVGVRSHAEREVFASASSGAVHVDVRVMHAAVRVRNNLHPFHVAVFGDAGIDDLARREVRTAGGNGEPFLHAHDEIRLAEYPLVDRRELQRRRRVGWIALRRTAVDPAHDGVQFPCRVSDGSSRYSPMLRSMCHGGICRADTRCLIARTHGRTS